MSSTLLIQLSLSLLLPIAFSSDCWSQTGGRDELQLLLESAPIAASPSPKAGAIRVPRQESGGASQPSRG